MRRIRLYHPAELSPGQTTLLNAEASHHLLHVLRKKTGEVFWVFNNSGAEFQAEILGHEKKQAWIKIGESSSPVVESSLNIHLGQAISRGDRMDYAVQKAVELGVSEITPLIAEFCQVALSSERFEKKVKSWQAMAISAAEQSGRCVVPRVHVPEKWQNWIVNNTAEMKYVCCPRASSAECTVTVQPKTVSVAIGPEGGFSDAEIQSAFQSGFHAFSLGPRVLRTETATVVALTLLQARWGDVRAKI